MTSKLLKLNLDFRLRQIETRNFMVGSQRHFQARTKIINLDGSFEFTEWADTGVILNYGNGNGLCEKPSFLSRLFNFKYWDSQK